MLICGPNGAGKTVLVNYLATGEFRDTVSSFDDTLVSIKESTYWEIPGHFHLRSKLIKAAEGAKVIVLLLDSKDREKFTEAGWILFDLLNNNTVNENQTPIIIACNKQDLQFAKKSTVIELELEKQVEEFKKVRLQEWDDDDYQEGVLEL